MRIGTIACFMLNEVNNAADQNKKTARNQNPGFQCITLFFHNLYYSQSPKKSLTRTIKSISIFFVVYQDFIFIFGNGSIVFVFYDAF